MQAITEPSWEPLSTLLGDAAQVGLAMVANRVDDCHFWSMVARK